MRKILLALCRTLAISLMMTITAGCAHSTRLASAVSTVSSTNGVAPSLARTIALRLAFDDRGLHVAVKATSSSADELREWKLGDDAPKSLVAMDANGNALAYSVSEKSISVTAPQSTVTLTYDVTETPGPAREDPRATLLQHAQFRVVGETMLVLPAAFDRKTFELTVDVDGKGLDAPVVASSFGAARTSLQRKLPTVMGAELRHAAFIGGAGGHAIFDAPEGHDEVAWIGYSAFDPRPAAAEVVTFRSTLHDHFKYGESGPQTMLLTVDGRPTGHFRVQRRTSGLLVAIGAGDPFEATLRLAVAHELVHAWIGDRLWIGDTRPGHESETYWFHEGYARWVAREQLYRVGLLSPDEYAGEVNRLYSIVTTTTKSGATTPTAVLVARGALHATLVDARIRAISKGKSSLDDVLRSLLREVEEHHRPIPEETWHATLAPLVGGEAVEKQDHDAMITTGNRTVLPADALGACFEPQEIGYDLFDPGFDVPASRDAGKISNVRANGPAAKAGTRDGDVLVKADETKTNATTLMHLEIERDGKASTITYRASAGSRRGPGFKKRASLSDEACRKLGLRK